MRWPCPAAPGRGMTDRRRHGRLLGGKERRGRRRAGRDRQHWKETGVAKITEIRCIRTRATATWVIVKVMTDQPGLYGIGSAHEYNATGAVVAAIEEWMAPRLIGRDATQIEDIWQSTFTSGYWRSGPTLNNALGGIDMALWDIKGKEAG